MSRFVIVAATVFGLVMGAAGSAQAADTKEVFDFIAPSATEPQEMARVLTSPKILPLIRVISPTKKIWPSVPMKISRRSSGMAAPPSVSRL